MEIGEKSSTCSTNAVMIGFSCYTDEKGKATSADTISARCGLLLGSSGKSYTIYTCNTNAGMIGFSRYTDEMGKATPTTRFRLTVVCWWDHLEKAAPYTPATPTRVDRILERHRCYTEAALVGWEWVDRQKKLHQNRCSFLMV